MFFEPETWVAVAFVILMVLFAYLGIHRTRAERRSNHRAERIKGRTRRRPPSGRTNAAKLLADYKSKANQRGGARPKKRSSPNAKGRSRAPSRSEAKAQDGRLRRPSAPRPPREQDRAPAEAQALADVRAAAANRRRCRRLDHPVAGRSRVRLADDLLAKGIAEVRAKLN